MKIPILAQNKLNMKEANNISFDDWKLKNPNGSLNEFYSQVKHPMPRIENINLAISVEREQIEISNFESKKLMFVGIITLIGIVGYFSPWFTIPLFNISISGNDLRQLSTIVSKFAKVNQNSLILKYSWAIPVSYILFFVGNLLKSYFLTFLSGSISIGYFLGIIILIHTSSFEIINFLSIGIYLLMINFLLILYYLFKF